MSKPRVLLVGWDAADWKVIRPLLKAGEMPHLARLMQEGVHGNLATVYPVLSPMLWTSIATGKRAHKHGIHGFSEPLPNGKGVRPVTTLSRTSKAIWNILNQHGHRSIVVGWWPSHPAEPINGVMVSNHFQQVTPKPGELSPLLAGSVHPAGRATAVADLRVNPMELTGEFIRFFIPNYDKVDQGKDKRLHMLCKIIAETMSVHAVATELIEAEDWDFAAVYYSAIDHFGHGFMSYHPPRLAWTSEADFEIYGNVISNAYRYHDAMLGRLLGMVDEETTVILMSDHGFHSDHMRPGYIPAEPAGPAVEHRHFGILCMKGPQLRVGAELHGASVLDICPTILSLYGLPPGRDMDGKVLTTAFRQAPEFEPIPSWDQVDGDSGAHPADAQLDPVASAEAFRQLVELGYVEPPGPNVDETVDGCVRELKYNLARALLDAGECAEAASLTRELWEKWPEEHRYGILLASCLGPIGQVGERRQVVEELGQRVTRYRDKARAELQEQKEAGAADSEPEEPVGTRAQKRRQYKRRKLQEQALDRPVMMANLWLQQALLEHNPAEARRHLELIERQESISVVLRHQLAEAFIQLGDSDEAQSLLEAALEVEPESPRSHAQLAAIHFKAGRYEESVRAATETLSLLYFQPAMHSLLGRALMALGRHEDAEKALRAAVAQSPGNLPAHEALAVLYRQHLSQPDKAFAEEGRAQSLRNTLSARRRASIEPVPEDRRGEASDSLAAAKPSDASFDTVAPFGPEVDTAAVITVVSGLPRSGTSLMMQLLVASGRSALTDGQRIADEDNPLGYFEFEPATRLARDKSWIPQARGKVVKIVAQLLPFLPRDEHYHIVFMDRNIDEVVASQRTMLDRLKRPGADADTQRLASSFRAQTRGVLAHLDRRSEVRRVTVSYEALLARPQENVEALARFLGGPFDLVQAVKAVRPELRRHKA